ncbi:hypothetical protein [Chitinophaga sp. CF418]|uniref:hypothetical protein n=1 Tax=Chitinophaga sp. CF418 TaxID=1855287 RepID=UPI00090F12A6|nr:hypothetical protein [Chitinophaga sp. CF418]SHN27513.1 hypothetical protein SAMN05216311_10812 [Chitinophaga sp. CF418]
MLNIANDRSLPIAQPMAFKANGETGAVNTNPQKGKHEVTKVVELNKNQSIMSSYSPNKIISGQRTYLLYSPLSSKLSQEDEYFMIENEMLGIVATGRTEAEAAQDFAQEFDFIYQRYNELSDTEMSERIKRIKVLLNTIVKEVNFK